MLKKKISRHVVIQLIVWMYVVCNIGIFNYKPMQASDYVTEHAGARSKNCCAWYVMKALWSGDCYVPIVRACDYEYVLPMYGFYKIKKTEPLQKGDIVVFPAIKHHPFGHIAMWNGRQWVSNFKQKHLIVASGYRYTKYAIYRHKDLSVLFGA